MTIEKRHIELTEGCGSSEKNILEVHNECKEVCHALCDG